MRLTRCAKSGSRPCSRRTPRRKIVRPPSSNCSSSNAGDATAQRSTTAATRGNAATQRSRATAARGVAATQCGAATPARSHAASQRDSAARAKETPQHNEAQPQEHAAAQPRQPAPSTHPHRIRTLRSRIRHTRRMSIAPSEMLAVTAVRYSHCRRRNRVSLPCERSSAQHSARHHSQRNRTALPCNLLLPVPDIIRHRHAALGMDRRTARHFQRQDPRPDSKREIFVLVGRH